MTVGPQWIVRKRRLKAYALAHGIAIPKGFRISPTCGKACRELIRRVEVKTWGPAAGTGKWDGRLTELIRPKMTLGERVLRIELAEKGTKEHPPGSNRGPRVDQYTATTGTPGAPWCAAFQTWAFLAAGRDLRKVGFNCAYCPSWVQTAKAGRGGLSLVARSEVRPGDVVTFDWEHDGVADHIGMVVTPPDSQGRFTSVEGNTAIGNDSNGGEVMVRDRTVSQVAAFIRVQ